MKCKLFIQICFIAILFCKTANSQSLNLKPGKNLYAFAQKFNEMQMECFRKGDLLCTAQFYADDAIIYDPKRIIKGRDSINSYWSEMKGGDWKLIIKEVGGSKKSIWVSGISEYKITYNNKLYEYNSDYIVIIKPDKDGQYKIFIDIYNKKN